MIRNIYKLYTNNNSHIIYMRNSFQKAFGKYLIWTNVVSSGILLGLGDLVQQEIEFRQKILSERYDFNRAGRMFLVGLACGPVHHYFYKYLDKFLPGQDLKSVGKKILIDQIVASPVCICMFFYGMGLLEFKTRKQMNQELNDKFLTVYTADWCIWPPTQFINFYYIPSKYRVLYINAITMFYDVFLSFIKHRDHEKIPNVITQ